MTKNTRYQTGANFERRAKEYIEQELVKQTKGTSIKYYVMRAAGSRGSLDLVILLTDTSTGHQRILGIQCKMIRPSYLQMDSFISQVKHKTGIDCFYCYKESKAIVFYPNIEFGYNLNRSKNDK